MRKVCEDERVAVKLYEQARELIAIADNLIARSGGKRDKPTDTRLIDLKELRGAK